MNYWEECIKESFEDAGIIANKKQIKIVVERVEGAYENYSLATGNDVADRNFIPDEARELEKLKKEQEKHEQWKRSTKPCKTCTATGIVLDGWRRNQTCDSCNGHGRY